MPVRRPALALPGAILTFVFLIAGINAPTMASAEGPQVNVYMFGDSTSDPGNMPFEPSPGNQVPVSRDVLVPIFPFSPTAVGFLHLRYSPNGIPSDGENFPYFVAADFGFEFLLGSQVTSLDAEPGKFVNFSLSGATQNSNVFTLFGLISPATPDYGSYGWQIQTFSKLVANSQQNNRQFKIKPKDVFIYYSTGANEALPQYYGLGPTDSAYVDAFKSNIDALYASGMRKLILVLQTSPNAANAPVLQLAAGGDPAQLEAMDAQLTQRQSGVLELLASSRWKKLEVQVHGSAETLGLLFSSPGAAVGTYPNLNTEADRGFWPITSPIPDPAGRRLPFIDEYHHTQFTDRRLALIVDLWLLQISPDLYARIHPFYEPHRIGGRIDPNYER
jgi:hypothetical protein